MRVGESTKAGKICQERKELLRSEEENRRNCKSGGEGGGVEEGVLAEGGVSDITLMNQCQRSDEKIIKKQARSVLNTAKGKRPILLYWNSVRMEKKSNTWEGRQKRCWGGKKIHIINDAKMPFRWHYESRQYK